MCHSCLAHCVTVSPEGKDEPSCMTAALSSQCKTINYAIQNAGVVVLQNFSYRYETNTDLQNKRGNITEQLFPIYIKGYHSTIERSVFSFPGLYSRDLHVKVLLFESLFLKEVIIVLRNEMCIFVDCHLHDVSIKTFNQSESLGHVQLIMDHTEVICRNASHGIKLVGNIAVKLLMSWSKFESCRMQTSVTFLLLSVLNTSFWQTEVYLKTNSFLKVLTIIKFENVVFNVTTSTIERNEIVLALHNPDILIYNCTFFKTSLKCISLQHQYAKNLYTLSIIRSKFYFAVTSGNGGSLMLSSGREIGNISLIDCHFSGNVAMKGDDVLSGLGGVIYIDGRATTAVLVRCIFENNVASLSGSALYTSQGVTLSIIKCVFHYQIRGNDQMSQPMLRSLGFVLHCEAYFHVINFVPAIYSSNIILSQIEQAQNLDGKNQCPVWTAPISHYSFMYPEKSFSFNVIRMSRLSIGCYVCSDSYYTVSSNVTRLLHNSETNYTAMAGQSDKTWSDGCNECPYGAVCTGNNILPRPNYWGYWHDGKLEFKQCPAGYCCSGSTGNLCDVYNYCAGNRTGILCGACQKGFSVSILSGLCKPDKQCGKDQWFWFLGFILVLSYALWYTLKGDILAIPSIFLYTIKSHCNDKRTEFQRTNSEGKSMKSNNVLLDDITSATDEHIRDHYDKGYFGIVTYFVQMTAIFRVKIEFSDIEKSVSFLDKIVESIDTLLNFELSQVSLDLCPVIGLTTRGKHLYKFVFLMGIFASWSILFILCVAILNLKERCKNRYKNGSPNCPIENIKLFKNKLISGIIEIIKYTYAGFCQVVFMSLACVHVGKRYVWFYDGSEHCFQTWQISIILFGVFYVLPFPFMLRLATKQLKEKQISPATFIIYCLFPFLGFCITFIKSYLKPCDNYNHDEAHHPSETSEVILGVLQGPYKGDEKLSSLYWEAMISIRRLLITAMTLVSSGSIRMTLISVLCSIFLYQHLIVLPFQFINSNYVEGVSLLLLLLSCMINLLKSFLTDSGVIPSGPSVPFLKILELFEKLFVLILLFYILFIESKHKCNSFKTGCRKEDKSETGQNVFNNLESDFEEICETHL